MTANEHLDFKSALDSRPKEITDNQSFNDLSPDLVTWALANYSLIEKALLIAHRLEIGNVSKDMIDAGVKYEDKKDSGFYGIFDAMSAQLIREVCDE